MNELYYNPESLNALERYMGLVHYAAEQGMAQEPWLLGLLEQLNLYGEKGNKDMEDKIFQAIRDKSIARDAASSLYIFEKPHSTLLPHEGVNLGRIFSVSSNNKIIDEDEPVIFKYPLPWLTQHVILPAKQGAGKTSLVANAVCSLARDTNEPVRVELIEFEKEDFKHLSLHEKKIEVYRPYDGSLILDINTVPPYTHPRAWANISSNIVEKSLGLPDGARRIYKIAYRNMQERYGVVESKPYPQYCGWLGELYEEVGRLANVHHATKSTLMMRLKECIETLGEKALGYGNENNLEQEETPGFYNYILHELDYSYRVLFLNLRLNRRLESRIGAMAQGYKPILALEIIDESKALLSDPTNRFFFNRLEATRGARIGIWFITQTSDIQKDALNACSLKILGKMDANEIYKLAPSLRLTDRKQIQWVADNLQQRFFIVRTDNGLYTKPFLIKVDDIQLVNSQAIIKPPEQRTSEPSVAKTTLVTDGSVSQPILSRPLPFSDIEMAYLGLFSSVWPALPITEYDHFVKINDCIGVGRSTGDRVRKKFLENGIIDLVLINAGGRIKKFNIPWVTQKGREFIPSEEASIPSLGVGAGIAHTYKCKLIGCILQKDDYVVDYDKAFTVKDSKYFVDVSAAKTNYSIAIEVEESLKHDIDAIRHNIKKCIEIGFNEVYLVLPTTSICNQVKHLQAEFNVKCVTLSHFIKLQPDLWQKIIEYNQRTVKRKEG
ncbi:MAG: hypothetical protein V1701_05255 [Planctomycetota bacterium]